MARLGPPKDRAGPPQQGATGYDPGSSVEVGFRTERQLAIGAALAERPLGIAELHSLVEGDRKSLKRQLARYKTEGFVEYHEGDGPPRPGHAAGLWSLTARGRDAWAAAATGHGHDEETESSSVAAAPEQREEPTDPSVLALRNGQLWVSAVVNSASRADVRTQLADGAILEGAQLIARLDGDQASYLFVFEESADQRVEDLVASLEGLGARCTSGTIRAVLSPADFVESMRGAQQARRRALEGLTASSDPEAPHELTP